jgi:hypothetical protein
VGPGSVTRTRAWTALAPPPEPYVLGKISGELVRSLQMLVIKSDGFLPGTSGSPVLHPQSQRFLGRQTAKIKFWPGRTGIKVSK